MDNTANGRKSALAIDRTTASVINPLISSHCTEDTLNDVSGMLFDLGYLLSIVADPPEGSEPTFGRLYRLCGAMAAALDYETNNMKPCGASLAAIENHVKGVNHV